MGAKGMVRCTAVPFQLRRLCVEQSANSVIPSEARCRKAYYVIKVTRFGGSLP
jgi:hypothetical protein